MSLSRYNPHSRYRDRTMQRVVRLFMWAGFAGLFAVVGFWFGGQKSAERTMTLNEQVEMLTQERNVLQDTVTELRAEAQTANTRYAQIKNEFNEQLPEGPMRDLTTLVRDQLDKGMDPQRLIFAIRSARPPTDCSEPETRRFIVSTPAYKGPDSTVSIKDTGIVIRGVGASARNDKGQPEAWYDPALRVSVTFSVNGVEDTKKGVLPIRHSLVSAGREYRFTIESGSRSFARVVFDSCAYP